jgi:hypothetical protein
MEPSDESTPPRPEAQHRAPVTESRPAGQSPGPLPDTEPHASAQQLLYARWLDVGTRVSFVVLVAAFVLYVSGIAPAYVPLEELSRAWGLPVADYLAAVNAPDGWGWIGLVAHGDYLNVLAVAMLTAVTIVCHLPLVVAYRSQRDNVYLGIVVAQIVILVAAASGILGGAHAH